MKVSLQRLSTFFSKPLNAQEVEDALLSNGIEVASTTQTGAGLELVVVAQIESFEKHADAEKLSVCQVFDGTDRLQIVCGAKNFQTGDKVALAKVGATLPNGLQIKKSKIRGVESFGMLCSEEELGFKTSSEGIMILSSELRPGVLLTEALGLQDQILELELTPNRGDCLSILGVAYEVSAALQLPINARPKSITKLTEHPLPIQVEDKQACPFYSLTRVEGVSVAPSDLATTSFLENSGIRSINNIVDITNVVLLERGQPLHAFDADLVQGTIVVRKAKKGETIVCLDEQKRELTLEDLVIADESGPIAIAGVMGGMATAVSEKTTNILLESALFDPKTVRKTSRRLALTSESSKRFEREIDGSKVLENALIACFTIQEKSAGVVTGTHQIGKQLSESKLIIVKEKSIERILGTPIPNAHEYLVRLGFEIVKIEEGWKVSVPPRRPEITREIDIIEEVARIYGFQNIKPQLAPIAVAPQVDSLYSKRNQLRSLVSGFGLSEVYTYSFGTKEMEENFQDLSFGPVVSIENPIVSEQCLMKSSLLPNLIEVWKTNQSRQAQGASLFEIGKVFCLEKGKIREEERLGVVFSGVLQKQSWLGDKTKAHFFTAKGFIEDLSKHLHINIQTKANTKYSCFHPGQSADLYLEDQKIGCMGVIHPTVSKGLDVHSELVLIELCASPLLNALSQKPVYQDFSQYPAVKRDLALVVKDDITHQQIKDVIMGLNNPIIGSVNLFDQYRGKGVEKGFQSLAYRFSFASHSKTLKDKEVDKILELVVKALGAQLGATLR